jgi:hypothetical protein
MSKAGESKALFRRSPKAGAVLRSDPLISRPIARPMTGSMTDSAARACLGILTKAGRSIGTRANGSIRARAYGCIRSRTDRGPWTRANA